MALGKLALSLTGHCSKRVDPDPHWRAGTPTLKRDGPAPHHGQGRTDPEDIMGAGSAPCLREMAPVARIGQLSYYSVPQLGLGLVHRNIYPN